MTTAHPASAPPTTAAQTTAAPTRAELRTVLTVGGMTCSHCVGHVETALADIPGVSAEVNLDAGTAIVTHPSAVARQTLLDAVQEAGYEVAVRDAAPR